MELTPNSALAQWPCWSKYKPRIVRQLTGGLTNSSFLIQAQQQKWVLRINAKNSPELNLNRETEYQILSLSNISHLAPRLIYCDPEKKFLVTEYLNGKVWSTEDVCKKKNIISIAKLLKAIHQLPSVNDTLEYKKKANQYWQYINPANSIAQSIKKIEDDIFWNFEQADKKCTSSHLCHNDLLANNLISIDSNKLYAIDWEYATMGDPYFDLAVVVESNQFNAARVQWFLQAYLDNSSEKELLNAQQRLSHSRVIYCYLTLLWYILQHERHGGVNTPYEGKMLLLADYFFDK